MTVFELSLGFSPLMTDNTGTGATEFLCLTYYDKTEQKHTTKSPKINGFIKVSFAVYNLRTLVVDIIVFGIIASTCHLFRVSSYSQFGYHWVTVSISLNVSRWF